MTTAPTAFFDEIHPVGRDSKQPRLKNCRHVCQSDRLFFARVLDANGRDTGSRDYAKFDATECVNWATSAPEGAPIIPDIEGIFNPVTKTWRTIPLDLRLDGTIAISEGEAYAKKILKAVRSTGRRPVLMYEGPLSSFDVQNTYLLKNSRPEMFRNMQLAHDYAARAGGIADDVDGHCISAYPLTQDVNVWKGTMDLQISECLRTRPELPIYVFVTPLFHPSMGGKVGNTMIPLAFWEEQLLHLRDQHKVAGIIAWNGNDSAVTWADLSAHTTKFSEIAGGWKRIVPKQVTMGVGQQQAAFPDRHVSTPPAPVVPKQDTIKRDQQPPAFDGKR